MGSFHTMTSHGRSRRTSSSSDGRSISTGAVTGAAVLTEPMMAQPIADGNVPRCEGPRLPRRARQPVAGTPAWSGLRHVARLHQAFALRLERGGELVRQVALAVGVHAI